MLALVRSTEHGQKRRNAISLDEVHALPSVKKSLIKFRFQLKKSTLMALQQRGSSLWFRSHILSYSLIDYCTFERMGVVVSIRMRQIRVYT